ncbi:MAG: monoheme cytochrome C [Flavobacteriaceae bacterium]
MKNRQFWKFSGRTYRNVIFVCLLAGILTAVVYTLERSKMSEPNAIVTNVQEGDFNAIENGIHVRTGLVEAEGLMAVVNNCTNCHSAKLVTQNRMNKEGWKTTIAWMQKTQNLWDLGDNEEIIINYLVTNYPPEKKGRRGALTNIEWYELKE